jgi:class 3 adenylate cyclase
VGRSPAPPSASAGACGQSLDAADTPVAQGQAASEQRTTPELRWVSVLFVDLVGFTTMSERMDAEDVRELLSGYFDVARRVIAGYGGRIEKFIRGRGGRGVGCAHRP